jgi:hypothetical protein
MAFMLMQRLTTAVLEGYQGVDVTEERQAARGHREWLESLQIDDSVKASLVEQAHAIEEAFDRLARRS